MSTSRDRITGIVHLFISKNRKPNFAFTGLDMPFDPHTPDTPDTPTPVTHIGLKICFRKSIKMPNHAGRTSRCMFQIFRPDKRPHPRESPASSCEPVSKKGGDLREITDGQ